jgi:hypothetical protein
MHPTSSVQVIWEKPEVWKSDINHALIDIIISSLPFDQLIMHLVDEGFVLCCSLKTERVAHII